MTDDNYFLPPTEVGSVRAAAAAWPCQPEMVACNANSVASLALASACADASHAHAPDGTSPSEADIAFWQRVADERDRIARWVVDGLGITGAAVKA